MYPVVLEVRESGRGSRRLSGSFPYGEIAVIRSSGRGPSAPRKERIESRAFGYVVDGAGRDRPVEFLSGHQFAQVLARRKPGGKGTLKLVDSDEALYFSADLPSERSAPSWVNDSVKAINAGLMTGISPGFQVPLGLKGAEALIPEEGNPGIYLRSVRQAVLHEISLVTRPAYPAAAVDLGKRSMPRPHGVRYGLGRLAWL